MEMRTCVKCGTEYPATHQYFYISAYHRTDPNKVYLSGTCVVCKTGQPRQHDILPWKEDIEAQVVVAMICEGIITPPTCKELGNFYGCSPQAINNIEKWALNKLSRYKHLKEFLIEDPGEPDPELFCETIE